MEADEYYIAGMALAVCIVHGGPAPQFLSELLYNALVYGPDGVTATLHDMPECELKEALTKVSFL